MTSPLWNGTDLLVQRFNMAVYNSTLPGIQHSCQIERNNSTNCTDNTYEIEDVAYHSPFDWTSVKVIFICLYGIVFLMCFVGNLLVIIVVLKHRKMRTITNFFLANLAVADLCVGIFCVLPNLSLYLSPYWVLGKVMCRLYYFVQAMSYTASVNILTIISVERFFAIIYPLRSKQFATMCILRLAVILVWVIAGGAGIPFLVFSHTVDIPPTDPVMTFCLVNDVNQKAYVTISFLFGYVVPLGLMTVMYSCISAVLWRSSHKIELRTSGGRAASTYTAKPVTRIKKGTNGQNIGVVTGVPYELGDKGRVCSAASYGTLDEQQKLMETNKRVSNATRLLKRMDSTLSEEPEANEGDVDIELNSANDWPGSGDNDRVSRSLQADIKYSFKMKRAELNDMTTKSTIRAAENQRPIAAPPRVIPQIHTKRQLGYTKCKQENVLLSRRRVIRLLIVVIVSFATCVLPYHIRILWQMWAQPNPSFWKILISPITFVIYYLNSGLNPLFYAFLSDRFRECLIEVITCRDYRARRKMSFTNRTMHSVT